MDQLQNGWVFDLLWLYYQSLSTLELYLRQGRIQGGGVGVGGGGGAPGARPPKIGKKYDFLA